MMVALSHCGVKNLFGIIIHYRSFAPVNSRWLFRTEMIFGFPWVDINKLYSHKYAANNTDKRSEKNYVRHWNLEKDRTGRQKKQSVHGFSPFNCYDNIAPNAKCQRVLVLALCLVFLLLSSVISYKITVTTGASGNTDVMEPSVHVTLFGTRGDSGRRLLFITNDRSPKFQPLQVSISNVVWFAIQINSVWYVCRVNQIN